MRAARQRWCHHQLPQGLKALRYINELLQGLGLKALRYINELLQGLG